MKFVKQLHSSQSPHYDAGKLVLTFFYILYSKEVLWIRHSQVATRKVLCKNVFLESHKIHRKTPVPESIFNKVVGLSRNFIKKEILAQMFSCAFCEISKSTFFIEHVWWLLLDIHCNTNFGVMHLYITSWSWCHDKLIHFLSTVQFNFLRLLNSWVINQLTGFGIIFMICSTDGSSYLFMHYDILQNKYSFKSTISRWNWVEFKFLSQGKRT